MVYYFAPFDENATDFRVVDEKYNDPQSHLSIGFYLSTALWQTRILNMGAGDALAFCAHGNGSLLLCSSRNDTQPNRAWIGPHGLWQLIHLLLPPHSTIVFHACHSMRLAKFFKNYMTGHDVWGFEGELGSERWKPNSTEFDKA